jgi:hypothetical protein
MPHTTRSSITYAGTLSVEPRTSTSRVLRSASLASASRGTHSTSATSVDR